jgi:hypothetical protein
LILTSTLRFQPSPQPCFFDTVKTHHIPRPSAAFRGRSLLLHREPTPPSPSHLAKITPHPPTTPIPCAKNTQPAKSSPNPLSPNQQYRQPSYPQGTPAQHQHPQSLSLQLHLGPVRTLPRPGSRRTRIVKTIASIPRFMFQCRGQRPPQIDCPARQ